MDRSTYYDAIAGCYKIAPDKSVNVIQRLGMLEDYLERYQHNAERAEEMMNEMIQKMEV